MAGVISGALFGLGGAMQTVGSDLFRSQLDEQKTARLAELQAKFRAQERTQENELAMKRDEARYNLENRDRTAIADEVKRYSQPRQEALPEDQAGPVGTVTPGESDLARRGMIAAMRQGRGDIANQFKAAGEPGKLELMAKEEEYKQAHDERTTKAAKELKQTAPAEGEASARLARAHAGYYEGAPARESQRESREISKEELQANRALLDNSQKSIKDSQAAIAKAQHDFAQNLSPTEKDRAALDSFIARENRNIQEQRAIAARAGANISSRGRASSGGASAAPQPPLDSFFKTPPGNTSPPAAKASPTKAAPTSALSPEEAQLLNAYNSGPEAMKRLGAQQLEDRRRSSEEAMRNWRGIINGAR